MEPNEILTALEKSKVILDNLTKELANCSKDRAEKERIFNKSLTVEIERARQEKIQATLIKDIVKGRLSDLIFARDIAEAKEEYIKNRLRDERSMSENLRSMLSYTKEQMKIL